MESTFTAADHFSKKTGIFALPPAGRAISFRAPTV